MSPKAFESISIEVSLGRFARSVIHYNNILDREKRIVLLNECGSISIDCRLGRCNNQ